MFCYNIQVIVSRENSVWADEAVNLGGKRKKSGEETNRENSQVEPADPQIAWDFFYHFYNVYYYFTTVKRYL